VAPDELRTQTYGPSTAAAVLAYKQRRNIGNYAYETKADNIVGKMTITRMDSDMLVAEKLAPTSLSLPEQRE
jgi:peptidoglycan hydrolase-like protein with peptidoglycan-binding domain